MTGPVDACDATIQKTTIKVQSCFRRHHAQRVANSCRIMNALHNLAKDVKDMKLHSGQLSVSRLQESIDSAWKLAPVRERSDDQAGSDKFG